MQAGAAGDGAACGLGDRQVPSHRGAWLCKGQVSGVPDRRGREARAQVRFMTMQHHSTLRIMFVRPVVGSLPGPLTYWLRPGCRTCALCCIRTCIPTPACAWTNVPRLTAVAPSRQAVLDAQAQHPGGACVLRLQALPEGAVFSSGRGLPDQGPAPISPPAPLVAGLLPESFSLRCLLVLCSGCSQQIMSVY